MHAPKMVNFLENYSAVLLQVSLHSVEDDTISKPTPIFFLEHSTTVTQCIFYYYCSPSVNMLFFSMLGYPSNVCL